MGSSLSTMTSPIATSVGFVVAMLSASYLYPSPGNSDLVNTLLPVCHLGAFSYAFGVQIWMSFVHGLTLIKLVPRYTFAEVQDVFFYKYFLSGFVMNGITLSTYLAMHPYSMWSGETLYMGSALLVSNLVSTLNVLFIKDQVSASMKEMHDYEQDNLMTNTDGSFKTQNFRENAEYMMVRKRFYRYHGISSMNNLVGVFASGMQLWFLARKLKM